MLPTTAYALTRIDGTVVLMVRGSLDDSAVPTLGEELESALRAAGPGQRVRVDLRGTSDISPAAFGLLAIFGQRLEGTGRSLALISEPLDDLDDELNEG